MSHTGREGPAPEGGRDGGGLEGLQRKADGIIMSLGLAKLRSSPEREIPSLSVLTGCSVALYTEMVKYIIRSDHMQRLCILVGFVYIETLVLE